MDTEYAGENYEMDPATEDLLANGRKLRNGMIVLVEDSMLRGDHESNRDYEKSKARTAGRWCEVSDLERSDGLVNFVGTYQDGTKKKRRYNQSYAWFVKNNTGCADDAPCKWLGRCITEEPVATAAWTVVAGAKMPLPQVKAAAYIDKKPLEIHIFVF